MIKKYLNCKATLCPDSLQLGFVYKNPEGEPSKITPLNKAQEEKDLEKIKSLITKFSEGDNWQKVTKDTLKAAFGKHYSEKMGDEIIGKITQQEPNFSYLQDKIDDVRGIQVMKGLVLFLDEDNDTIAFFSIRDVATEIIQEDWKQSREAAIKKLEDRPRNLRHTMGMDPYEFDTMNDNITRRLDEEQDKLSRDDEDEYEDEDEDEEEEEDEEDVPAKKGKKKKGEKADEVVPKPIIIESKSIEKSEMEREADNRREAMYKDIRDTREGFLITARTFAKDEDFDNEITGLDEKIRDEDAENFERKWNTLNNGRELDSLLIDKPNPATGYTENPFVTLNWNRDKIRQLIQGEGFWNDNDVVSYKDIDKAVYSSNDAFESFLKNHSELPKPILNWLEFKTEKSIIGVERPIYRYSDGLQKTIQELTRIEREIDAQEKSGKKPEDMPEEIRELAKHHEAVKTTLNILGDYFAYSSRMLHLIANLKYVQQRQAAPEDYSDIFEVRADEPEEVKRTKLALDRVFMNGVQSPEEYRSEMVEFGNFLIGGYNKTADLLSGVDTPDSERLTSLNREITFQDLNGATASINTDWFSQRISPRAGYKLAYEAAQKQRFAADGTPENYVDPKVAANFLNHLLQLGMHGIEATSPTTSLKKMFDDLTEVGATTSNGEKLRFTNNAKADIQNLYEALALRDLSNLDASENKTEEKKNEIFQKLVQIGAVIYQQTHAEKKRSALENYESSKRPVTMIISGANAYRIVDDLRATKQFREEDLTALRNNLTMGIGGAVDTSGKFRGLGVTAKYEMSGGTSISFGLFTPDGSRTGVGIGVGQKIDIQQDLTVNVNFGGGVLASKGELPGGWGVGGSAGITKKFDGVALSLYGGAGVSGGGAGLFAGGGVDWSRTQERITEKITKQSAEEHIAEVESAPYEKVRANPQRYPELYAMLYRIETLDNVDQATKEYMFNESFKMYKEGIREAAVDESSPSWWEYFIPQGVDGGMSTTGPFLALKFPWPGGDRKLVFRIAGDQSQMRDYMEKSSTQAIVTKIENETNTTVTSKKIELKGVLIRNPVNGELAYQVEKSGTIDFAKLDTRFEDMRRDLFRDSKIIAEKTNFVDSNGNSMNLIELRPVEAHGNLNVYVDPKLGTDVAVVIDGSKIYLSVKNGAKVSLKRHDLSYPFLERGQTEDTFITITGENPHFDRETIAYESDFYFDRTPQSQWVRRPSRKRLSARDRPKQSNLMNMNEFRQLHENYSKGLDRMNLNNGMEHMQRAYGDFTESRREAFPKEMPIRSDLLEIQNKLTNDKIFMDQIYKVRTTEKYNIEGSRKDITWSQNYSNLLKEMNERVQTMGKAPLNALEMDSLLFGVMIESFQNIQKGSKENAQKLYKHYLDNFEKPMLEAFFTKFYEGKEGATEKTKAAVKWAYDEMAKVDITIKGEKVERGTLFASIVGTFRVTGLRQHFNYNETSTEWGVIGKKVLNYKASGPEGDVARFWMETLSPFDKDIITAPMPSLSENPTAHTEFQKKIQEGMHSPLALKVGQLLVVAMLPTEIDQLTETYKNPTVFLRGDKLVTARKFLGLVQKVREAQLNGDETLELNKNFTLRLDKFEIAMGAFKRCGNISGLMTEEFSLEDKNAGNSRFLRAGLAEGLIDVKGHIAKLPRFIPIGIAIPAPIVGEVTPIPREERPPSRPPVVPEKQVDIPTGKEVPPVRPIPSEPPVVTIPPIEVKTEVAKPNQVITEDELS